MVKSKIVFDDIGFAKLDPNRKERTGIPEAVFCKGKKSSDVGKIIKSLREESAEPVIGTKATKLDYEETLKLVPEAKYYEEAKLIVAMAETNDGVSEGKSLRQIDGIIEAHQERKIIKTGVDSAKAKVAVVTGGTCDIPIAEEAAVTLETFGASVNRVYDVGVAGIERLLAKTEEINEAETVIVIAGMEGALASVVGGLVKAPIIAVPTSVGYGANFEGIAALLSMLNSCAPGVTIVNIDNGFGAACAAIKILKL